MLRGYPAHARVASRWPTFAVDGRGVRCVSDRPWITAAETCELVMALDALGVDDQARQLFASVQFLRADGGGYWTGANFDGDVFHGEGDGELYPAEQPSWNSAAVVLAANALAGTGPTAGLFRGERLPDGLSAEALLAAGVEIEHEPRRPPPVLLNPLHVLASVRSAQRYPERRQKRSGNAAEDAQAAGRRRGHEVARRDCAPPHLVRRLTTVGRVFEHVVEHEQATTDDVT